VFCAVREKAQKPLCRFYAAAFERMLTCFDVPTSVTLAACRGAGDETCVLTMMLRPERETSMEAA
jgi:predicted hydrocarbon binding protein